MSEKPTSVLSSIRPEYVPLEQFLSEPLAWCPPTEKSEDTTLYVIVKSGSEESKILKLANGRVTKVSARQLPFESPLVVKPITAVQVLKKILSTTTLIYVAAAVVLVSVLGINTGLIGARAVLTNSMSGTFEPGDVVVTANWAMPKVGDIAMYRARDFKGNVQAEFVHRVVSGDTKTGFEFKGDNNPTKDPLVVPQSDVIGTVIFWIPSIGTLLKPSNILAVLAVGIFIYFGVGYLRDEVLERKLIRRKRVAA